MSVGTLERSSQLAIQSDIYPLKLFCEEHMTFQEAIETVLETYQYTDGCDDLPPSFEAVLDGSFFSYLESMMYRAWYHGGVDWYGDVQEQMVERLELSEDGDLDAIISEMIEEMISSGIPFNTNSHFGQLWIHDIEYLLNALGLFYIHTNYEDPGVYIEFKGKGSLPDKHLLVPKNCPIVEVW